MRKQTRALIVAGRAIDKQTLRYGQLAELRDAVRAVPDLEVVVGTDEQTGADPKSAICARVVVGYVLDDIPSEKCPGVTADPLGPLHLDRLRAGLARARALDAITTKGLARVLPRSPTGFTPAQLAAALTTPLLRRQRHS